MFDSNGDWWRVSNAESWQWGKVQNSLETIALERVLKKKGCDVSFPSEKNILGNSDMKQLAVSDTGEDNLVLAIVSLFSRW